MCVVRAERLDETWERTGRHPEGTSAPPAACSDRDDDAPAATDRPRAAPPAARGGLRDALRRASTGEVAAAGILGTSLLVLALAWLLPRPGPAVVVGIAAGGVCAIMAWWHLAPRRAAVSGAHIVLTDDDRGWLVTRRPLGMLLLDGSCLPAGGQRRALAERVVRAHVTGAAGRVESLALLDRLVAVERLSDSRSLGAHRRDGLTPERQALLVRHAHDALVRDVELVETRRSPRPRAVVPPLRCVAARREP